MADISKKASMSQVTDIKPYTNERKSLWRLPVLMSKTFRLFVKSSCPRYRNVQLMLGLTNNKPDFRIQVKGLFGTEEKRFEVVGGYKKKDQQSRRNLTWVGLISWKKR